MDNPYDPPMDDRKAEPKRGLLDQVCMVCVVAAMLTIVAVMIHDMMGW